MRKQIKRLISIQIVVALLLQQTALASGLVVDSSAPKNNQATIDKARNNVPVVNIVTPNNKGLSHNKFNKYNVNKEGLILNNSNKKEVNTQLSGYIYGNENLKNGTAKTILNEVTSRNKTYLKGFTEIAGDRANIVIANPNGIYINGAGFINTSKATITTGNPNILNGELRGFNIRTGQIDIDGTGLNVSNINKAELYAKAIKLNAKIYAQNLDIVTGENNISRDGIITNIEDELLKDKPLLAIDSTNLGGIYANKINLIGTSKGVGVNLPIEITSQDDFKLSADGKIFLDKVISEKSVDIKSNSSDVSSKTIYANNVKIEAKDNIINQDTIASKIDIKIESNKLINENIIASGVEKDLSDSNHGNLSIKSDNLENKGTLYSKDNIDIDSKNIQNLKNSNLISNNDILIKSENIINEENVTIKAKNNLNINSKNSIVFKDNKILSNNMNLNSYKIYLDGTNTTNNILYATNDISINANDFYSNYLLIQANNNINITTTDIKINDSKYISTNNIDLKANNNLGFSKNELKALNANFLLKDRLELDKNSSIKTQNSLIIDTKSLVNDAEIISNNNLEIISDFIENNSLISSKNKLDLNAKNYILNNDSKGGIKASETNINTKLLTNYGFISSQNSMNLNLDSLVNYGGVALVNIDDLTSDMNIKSNNFTNYNTVYSNGNINLYIRDLLLNQTDNKKINLGNEQATIVANNSINIRANKENNIKTNKVVNDKAIVQTQKGDINIYANSLDNLASNPNVKGEYLQSGNTKSIKDGERTDTTIIARDKSGYAYNAFKIYTDEMSYDKNYEYSSIISGRDMSLDAKDINNNYSLIFTKNNLNIMSNNLINKTIEIVKLITTNKDIYVEKKKKHKAKGGKIGKVTRSSSYSGTQTTYDVEVVDKVNSTIQAGGKITANLNKLSNGMIENKVIEVTSYTPNVDTKVKTVDIDNNKNNIERKEIKEDISSNIGKEIKKDSNTVLIDNSKEDEYKLPTNKYSVFTTVDPNKNLDYLIESNPLYTNYDNYIGSPYLLEKMGYTEDRKTKRLGDAAYETKLVSDAIYKQTGQRVLNPDFQNENEQFISLMENAVNLNASIGFELGKPLSKEQIASLTEDIVWMEERLVNGQIVLVPVVYLANDYSQTKGATIIANNIDLDIKDSLNNSGNIKSNNDMNINANSITNNSGVLLSGGRATLISNEDFINKNGGQIKADELAIASLSGSVINETYSNTYTEDSILNKKTLFGTKQVKNGDFTNTEIGKTSSIESTGGDLVIFAKEDITNIGANLKAENSVILKTQDGDINLNAIKKESGHNLKFSGGFDKSKDVEYQTSDIEANNILMQSGNDINLQASKLKAKEDINLSASNDVNVEALNNEYYRDRQITTKGTFSKKTTRDMEYKESVNSSEFDANNIYISSGNDVNLQATKLKAKENIVVDADNSINILAKEYKEGSLHQTSKSSFGGLKKSLDIESTDALKLNSALLETEASNIVLNSGKDINILASEINSAGDIQLKALEDILIASQSEYLAKKEVHEKSSFNLAGLVSVVVPVETTLYSQEISKNDKVNSTNVSSSLNAKNDIKIDSGSTTIVGSNLEANNIDIKADTGEINILSSQDIENISSFERKIEVGLSDITSVIKDQYKDLMKGNTKLKFEIGSAEFDEVDQSSQRVTNNASSLKARDSIVLDSLSDINIVGSNLESEENITLSSTVGDVNILSSTDSYSQNIDEKHGSAKISLTLQNEYVEIAQAVDSAVKSAEQLKQTKDDYSNYKSEVKKLENNLSKLKESYNNKEVGVDYTDIEDLSDFIDNLKSQEKYYVAAIASATADLASKTVAIATQSTAAGASSATAGFSAGVSLDVDGSKTNTQNKTTSSNASNLVSNNITINAKEDTNITGSNIVANDSLNINTNNLNVKASQDTTQTSQDSESLNGSVNLTMYGGGGGTASLGGGKQNFQSNSVTNNNSQLLANNVNIDVKNDANFIGANVRAEDTLKLNVGNNLTLESLRDESSTNQSGFNVNAGIGLGSGGKESHRAPSTDIGKVSSANAGLSMNNGVSQSKQTVLSSITGNEVNINVGGNTHLKGSLIASDEDNLNFTTNTLTFANSSNSSYSSSTNIGTNLNYNLDDKKVENQKEKPQQKGVSSVGYNSENSIEADASKTLATLGSGNITVKDKENSDDMDRLNRDKDNVNKDLYSSTTGTKVDATLDTRLLTEEGQEQIAKDFTEVKDTIKTISNSVSNYFDTRNTEKNEQKFQQALVDLKVKDPQQYEDTMVAMRELDRILKEQPQNISNDERLAALPLALIPPLIYELLVSSGILITTVAVTQDNRNNLVGSGISGEDQKNLLHQSNSQNALDIKRPTDIPDDWIERESNNGGKIWEDPTNPKHNNTRIEPGGKNQKYPKSYRKDLRDGQYKDKDGDTVPKNSPEAHQDVEIK